MDSEKLECQLKGLEAKISEQEKLVETLQSAFSQVKTALEKLQEQIQEMHQRSVATCNACSIEFDLFANHYSIGLFDNIVYVKCPRCHKSTPVDSRDGLKKT